MKLRTAAYIAIALHFARSIYRKLNPPPGKYRRFPGASRSSAGEDGIFIARPKGSDKVVEIMRYRHDCPMSTVFVAFDYIEKVLDRCEIRYCQYPSRTDLFTNGRLVEYLDYPYLDDLMSNPYALLYPHLHEILGHYARY
jgi:hypothetical protein